MPRPSPPRRRMTPVSARRGPASFEGVRSVVVLNGGERVDIRFQNRDRVLLDGRVVDRAGGIYHHRDRVVLLGWQGKIALPRSVKLLMQSGYASLQEARIEHFAPGAAREAAAAARARAARIDPRDPQSVLQAVLTSTEPTGLDYFFGPVLPSNPFVMEHRAHMAEAARFAQQFPPDYHPRITSKGTMYTDFGAWLDEAVGASPNIAGAEHAKHWVGARKYTTMVRQQLVDVVREVDGYRVRYGAMLDQSAGWVNRLEIAVRKSILEPPPESQSWWGPRGHALLFFGGLTAGILLGGVGAGVAYGVADAMLTEGLLDALIVGGGLVGGFIGGWTGHAVGAPLQDGLQERARSTFISEAVADINKLRTVKQKLNLLRKEGVHHRVVEGMADILKKYHRDVKWDDISDQEREEAARKAKREMEDLMRRNRKRGADWNAMTSALMAAGLRRDPKGFGAAIVGMCHAGNEVAHAASTAVDTRIDRIARAEPRRVFSEPASLWI